MDKKYPEPIVGALIVDDSGKILLIESPKWDVKYTLPGGHVELGETIENAIKREVKEEIGLNISFEKVLFIQEAIFPKGFKRKKHFIFIECVCKANDWNVKIDNDEVTGIIWIEPEKALDLDIEEYTKKFISEYLKDRSSCDKFKNVKNKR